MVTKSYWRISTYMISVSVSRELKIISSLHQIIVISIASVIGKEAARKASEVSNLCSCIHREYMRRLKNVTDSIILSTHPTRTCPEASFESAGGGDVDILDNSLT